MKTRFSQKKKKTFPLTLQANEVLAPEKRGIKISAWGFCHLLYLSTINKYIPLPIVLA